MFTAEEARTKAAERKAQIERERAEALQQARRLREEAKEALKESTLPELLERIASAVNQAINNQVCGLTVKVGEGVTGTEADLLAEIAHEHLRDLGYHVVLKALPFRLQPDVNIYTIEFSW